MPARDEKSTEDRSEKLDRELIEFLNELRVTLPGVQVLFAFLLTVPFSQRFERVSGSDRSVYFAAFLLTTASSVLLMAPSAYHRLRWRQYDKEHMLKTSNKLAIAGIASLAGAVGAVVYLITDVLYGSTAAAVAAGCALGALVWFWFGLPLSRPSR